MYFKQIHTEHFSYSTFHWSQHPEPSAQWLIWLTFHTIYRQCLDTYSAATPVNAKPSLPGNVLRLRKRQDNVTTISWPPPLPLSPCLITFQLLQLIPDPQFPQRVGSEMKGVGWSFSPPGLFPSMSDPPSHSVSFDSWLGFSIYTHTHTHLMNPEDYVPPPPILPPSLVGLVTSLSKSENVADVNTMLLWCVIFTKNHPSS